MENKTSKKIFNLKTIVIAVLSLLLILIFLSRTIYNFNLPAITAVLPQNGRLAKLFGLRITDKRRLKRNLKQKTPVTTFYFNEEFTLWVDRYFIAYSRSGYLDVWYIYITREHVRAELREISALIRGKSDFLSYVQLSNIKEQIMEALREMRMTGIDSYIFYDNLSEIHKTIKSGYINYEG